tara:strand:- start:1581 stop:2039 length:459 start_codon:yes stop_codon:yes gene_type:complete
MKNSKMLLPVVFLFGLTGCQTMNAYECAMGGCAATNAQKRQVLQAEQQRGAQLRSEQANTIQTQQDVRSELGSVQKQYNALSSDISRLQEDLRKAGKQNSEAATELANLQRDVNLRQNMASSSTTALQEQELKALRDREKKLRAQVKLLLAH